MTSITEIAPAPRGRHRDDLHRTSPRRRTAIAAMIMLIGSAACVAIAPVLMPESYSIVEHAVSASAGQGVENAWVTRVGFLLIGFGVLTLAAIAGREWGPWGRSMHRVYGVSMMAAAAFAHQPWEDVPFVEFEDFLHSIAASAVGFGFTVGVLFVALRRGRDTGLLRWFDGIAVIAALVIPITMFNVAGIEGAVQRVLFLVGYLWYGTEAARMARTPTNHAPVPAPEAAAWWPLTDGR
ncbi:MAG: DUF998 domain-containing protein [Acidimicrobiia bacterium]|nr:DUF998 domain-containing protein [Acidimicrobiia bacterium]